MHYVLIYFSQAGIKNFLTNRSGWMMATNDAMKFPSKAAAKQFVQDRAKRGQSCGEPIATQLFIQGPRGGVHRLSEV